MASTSELLVAGMFLLVNTIVIAIYVLIGGPLFGSIFSWISLQKFAPDSLMNPTMIQWIPSFFFGFLLVLEIVLIVRLAFVVVSKTDYQGNVEW